MKTFLFVMTLIGVSGSTARYLHQIRKYNKTFSWLHWMMSCFTAIFMCILAGFLCEYYEVHKNLQYPIVGLVAISSKELIDIIPNLLVSWVKRRAG